MTTTTLPVIGYTFNAIELFMIPTQLGRACFSCGCFVGVYPGEQLAAVEPHPEAVGKKAIFLEEGLRQSLTEQELQAILLHEEGHAVLDHLAQMEAGRPRTPEIELEADRYAVEHGAEPEALRRGVEKALHLVSERLTITGPLRSFRAALIRWLTTHSKEYRLRMRQLKSFR